MQVTSSKSQPLKLTPCFMRSRTIYHISIHHFNTRWRSRCLKSQRPLKFTIRIDDVADLRNCWQMHAQFMRERPWQVCVSGRVYACVCVRVFARACVCLCVCVWHSHIPEQCMRASPWTGVCMSACVWVRVYGRVGGCPDSLCIEAVKTRRRLIP